MCRSTFCAKPKPTPLDTSGVAGNLRAVRFSEIYVGVLSRSLIVDQTNSAAPSAVFR